MSMHTIFMFFLSLVMLPTNAVVGLTKVQVPSSWAYDISGPIDNSSVISIMSPPDKNWTARAGERVAYGKQAAPGDFPYFGLMYVTQNSGQYGQCAATLVAPRVAMTAGHCLNMDSGVKELDLAFGITKRSEFSSKSRSAMAWISHEKYNDNTLQNDIGLVAFNSSVDAPTVALSDITDTANMPNPLYVAGFGLTESEYLSGSISVSSALIYAQVPPMSLADCKTYYESISISPPTTSHICAGGVKSDACAGDSGGPLSIEGARWPTDGYTQNIQVGITSMGPVPCGGPSNVGAYTNVAMFTKWINDQIYYNNWEGSSPPSVLNTLVGKPKCFSGEVITTTTEASGGNCCAKCKNTDSCGIWSYTSGSQCTLYNGYGWTDSTGTCTSGWLNRQTSAPSGTTSSTGYQTFTSTGGLDVYIGATTQGMCAQACLDNDQCGYYVWLGAIGSETFNAEGANCRLVGIDANPTESTEKKGNSWGTVPSRISSSPEPIPSPSPLPPESPSPSPQPTPSPPSPSSPPPVLSPPPPTTPLPPSPTQKKCILDGTYAIYSKGRSSCSSATEYLGFPDTGNKACDYIRPKLKSGYFRNAPRWIISSDSKGDVSITAIRPCAKRGLTSSSTTSSRTRVYLSKPGNRWTLIPVSGSCDHVYIQSTKRAQKGYSSYMSASWRCSSKQTYMVNTAPGKNQQWGIKKISNSKLGSC